MITARAFPRARLRVTLTGQNATADQHRQTRRYATGRQRLAHTHLLRGKRNEL